MRSLHEFVQEKRDGVTVNLYAQPGANSSRFVGIHGDRLKVAVAAKAVANEANKEIVNFIAKILGVARSSVTLLHGHKSRQKTLFIKGNPSSLARAIQAIIRGK